MPATIQINRRSLASLILASVLAVGPLGFLQTVAWTTMALDYGQRYGWAEGLSRTFDGKNPCSLCHSITETKREQSSQHSATLTERWQPLGPTANLTQLPPPSESDDLTGFLEFSRSAPTRVDRPALPPPRHLAA